MNFNCDLFQLIEQLNERKISFALTSVRDNAVMVQIAAPGERWEVEFFADGKVEIEKFRSSGEITGKESLQELFDRFSD